MSFRGSEIFFKSRADEIDDRIGCNKMSLFKPIHKFSSMKESVFSIILLKRRPFVEVKYYKLRIFRSIKTNILGNKLGRGYFFK